MDDLMPIEAFECVIQGISIRPQRGVYCEGMQNRLEESACNLGTEGVH